MATRRRAAEPSDAQAGLLPDATEATDGEMIAGPEATIEEVGEIIAERGAAELEPEAEDEDIRLPPDEQPVLFERPTRNVDPVLEHATAKLFAQITCVMEQLGTVEWNKRNSQGGYQYASIDAFLGVVRPIMARNGLVSVPVQESTGVSSYRTSNGEVGLLDSTWKFLICSAVEDDAYIPITLRAVAPASMGAQAYGAVLSYALKNALRALFQIATGEVGEDVDQTHGQPLAPRPTERTRRQDPPGYAPNQQRQQAPPADDGGRIVQRSRQPAGNGQQAAAPVAPASAGARSTVFKLRARLNRAGIKETRVLPQFGVETLEALTDDQIKQAHASLDEVGVEA